MVKIVDEPTIRNEQARRHPSADEEIGRQFQRMGAAASKWLEVRKEQACLAASRAAFQVAATTILAVVAVTVLATAAVLLVLGGATLLALALETPGLAQTLVGGAIVLLALLVAWSIPRAAARRADRRLHDKYGPPESTASGRDRGGAGRPTRPADVGNGARRG